MEWYMGGYTLNSNIYQNDFKTGEAEARQSGRYWEEHVKLMGFSTSITLVPILPGNTSVDSRMFKVLERFSHHISTGADA